MEKLIRDPEFSKRLEQACEANAHCPAQNYGRLGWIVAQMRDRFQEKVSAETVRKWLSGETKPKGGRHEKLAQLLAVDPVWLYFGIDAEVSPRERRVRNAEADGIVNVVAGFIQMDGGSPAFPEPEDKRAKDGAVDLYAIIRGANYAFHVATGTAADGGYKFHVPPVLGSIVLGVVRERFCVRIFEISEDDLAGARNSGGSRALVFSADEIAARALESFANRL